MLNITVLLLLSSLMLVLAATGAAAIASQDPVSEIFKGNGYLAEDSSYNNSSISFAGQNKVVSAPVDLTAGNGYYSSHPISIGLGIGSRTQLANGNSATSMSHEVDSAQEVSVRMEYMVSSGSSQSDYEDISSATTHMQIDETVTSGKVRIGVLSGSDSSAGNSGYSGTDPLISAWKNPAIEIEEEYIGTYHISKNFTINNSYTQKRFADGWLSCCGESYVIYPPEPVFISADDVFNCVRCK